MSHSAQNSKRCVFFNFFFVPGKSQKGWNYEWRWWSRRLKFVACLMFSAINTIKFYILMQLSLFGYLSEEAEGFAVECKQKIEWKFDDMVLNFPRMRFSHILNGVFCSFHTFFNEFLTIKPIVFILQVDSKPIIRSDFHSPSSTHLRNPNLNSHFTFYRRVLWTFIHQPVWLMIFIGNSGKPSTFLCRENQQKKTWMPQNLYIVTSRQYFIFLHWSWK